MSGFSESSEDFQPSWLECLGAAVLKIGPIPKHIAIILDGNRRYAKLNKLGNVSEGHKAGGLKLEQVVDMLLLLGVQELTVYAFSMENFKRSMSEVTALLKLFHERSTSSESIKIANEKGICLEFIGNSSLNPSEKLQKSIERNMILTKDNKILKVNFAFIYTGRNEICRGINDCLGGISERKIEIDDLTETVIPEFFNLHPSKTSVDILIRTSGECRFSDFMIWQCDQALIEFVDVNWPEFTYWDLLKTIFRYQAHYYKQNLVGDEAMSKGIDERVKKYIDEKREQKWNQLKIPV